MGFLCKNTINSLLEEVVKYNITLPKVVQHIYLPERYGDWRKKDIIKGKDIKDIILANKDEIVADITKFLSNEKWYDERSIPYRRGIMLYGKPGNGKTSLCIALAMNFNKDIYFMSLNDIKDDAELFYKYSTIPSDAILVIEDMDVSDKKKDDKSGPSLSALLNCMDGMMSKRGLITIITTNNPDNIYEPLLRPGRIDKRIAIDNPSKTEVELYLSKFYSKLIILPIYTKDYSMSTIQGLCLSNQDNELKVIENLSKNTIKDEKFNKEVISVQS